MAFFKKEERKQMYDLALQNEINENLLTIYNEIIDLLKLQRQQLTDKKDIPEDFKPQLIKQHQFFEQKITVLYKTLTSELFNKKLTFGQVKVILDANKKYVESFNNPLSETVHTQMEEFGSLARDSNLSYQTQSAILDVKNAGMGLASAFGIVALIFVSTIALAVVTGGLSTLILAGVGIACAVGFIPFGLEFSLGYMLEGKEKRDLVTQRSIGVEEAGDKFQSTYKTAMAQ